MRRRELPAISPDAKSYFVCATRCRGPARHGGCRSGKRLSWAAFSLRFAPTRCTWTTAGITFTYRDIWNGDPGPEQGKCRRDAAPVVHRKTPEPRLSSTELHTDDAVRPADLIVKECPHPFAEMPGATVGKAREVVVPDGTGYNKCTELEDTPA